MLYLTQGKLVIDFKEEPSDEVRPCVRSVTLCVLKLFYSNLQVL